METKWKGDILFYINLAGRGLPEKAPSKLLEE